MPRTSSADVVEHVDSHVGGSIFRRARRRWRQPVAPAGSAAVVASRKRSCAHAQGEVGAVGVEVVRLFGPDFFEAEPPDHEQFIH